MFSKEERKDYFEKTILVNEYFRLGMNQGL